jgi:sugar O-acyltransferase (sialic acid O-acetyltransferase NeuD family)
MLVNCASPKLGILLIDPHPFNTCPQTMTAPRKILQSQAVQFKVAPCPGNYSLTSRQSELSEVNQFCIYGAGGHAKDLVAQLIFDLGRDSVLCLVDDFNPDRQQAGFDVLNFDTACLRHPKARWLIAVGDPSQRMRIAQTMGDRVGEEGWFISSRAFISHDFVPTSGVQVLSGCCISAEVTLGRSTIVNVGSTISHESKIGAFVSISPGCTLAGRVRVEDQVFVGAGATILNGTPERPITIGKKSVIGAGAVVIRDVIGGDVVVGVPARSLRRTKC